jgi:3-dehydroquinate dehydratase
MAEALRLIEKAEKAKADFIEIRLDCLKNHENSKISVVHKDSLDCHKQTVNRKAFCGRNLNVSKPF